MFWVHSSMQPHVTRRISSDVLRGKITKRFAWRAYSNKNRTDMSHRSGDQTVNSQSISMSPRLGLSKHKLRNHNVRASWNSHYLLFSSIHRTVLVVFANVSCWKCAVQNRITQFFIYDIPVTCHKPFDHHTDVLSHCCHTASCCMNHHFKWIIVMPCVGMR